MKSVKLRKLGSGSAKGLVNLLGWFRRNLVRCQGDPRLHMVSRVLLQDCGRARESPTSPACRASSTLWLRGMTAGLTDFLRVRDDSKSSSPSRACQRVCQAWKLSFCKVLCLEVLPGSGLGKYWCNQLHFYASSQADQ